MANKTLYVGNLPHSVTEAQLISFFSAFGGENVRVMTGQGFAFVDVDADRMEAAITENHQGQIGGRMITVKEAQPRDEQFASGGMGNGYGHRSDLMRRKR